VTTSGPVREVASADFPTRWGRFRIHGFQAAADNGSGVPEEAVALVMGDVQGSAPLVRIHS